MPLRFIGVIWMLLLTHTTLSITSFMGVITMIGIVVSNGILVDFANKLQERGVPLRDAVVRAVIGGLTISDAAAHPGAVHALRAPARRRRAASSSGLGRNCGSGGRNRPAGCPAGCAAE